MISFLLVGAGGAVGAMFRYGLVGFVQNRVPFSTFPYGTLTVNLCGCLLIGALTGLGVWWHIWSGQYGVWHFL